MHCGSNAAAAVQVSSTRAWWRRSTPSSLRTTGTWRRATETARGNISVKNEWKTREKRGNKGKTTTVTTVTKWRISKSASLGDSSDTKNELRTRDRVTNCGQVVDVCHRLLRTPTFGWTTAPFPRGSRYQHLWHVLQDVWRCLKMFEVLLSPSTSRVSFSVAGTDHPRQLQSTRSLFMQPRRPNALKRTVKALRWAAPCCAPNQEQTNVTRAYES